MKYTPMTISSEEMELIRPIIEDRITDLHTTIQSPRITNEDQITMLNKKIDALREITKRIDRREQPKQGALITCQ